MSFHTHYYLAFSRRHYHFIAGFQAKLPLLLSAIADITLMIPAIFIAAGHISR